MALLVKTLKHATGLRASVGRTVLNAIPTAVGQGGLSRRFHVSVCCSAGVDLTSRIKEDMKVAMKARDTARLEAIRFLNAAIKQREIELRETGKQVTDADVLGVLQKMSKQRRDSIEQYKAGGRQDLADKEEQELQVLLSYLPKQLSKEEVSAIVQQAVAESGASSVKQMGQVMKLVTAKTAGQADNKMVSELVKAALSAK